MNAIQKRLNHGEVFEYQGEQFRFEVHRDDAMGEPWKEHDGHGVISDWTRRSKAAGERVLAKVHGSYCYYNIPATMKLATQDGWGISDEDKQKLAEMIGGEPTKRQIVAEAVNQDYSRMRAWCNDDWFWVRVKVTLLKEDEDAPNGYFETRHYATLGGIESDCEDYLTDVAYELAAEVLGERGRG